MQNGKCPMKNILHSSFFILVFSFCLLLSGCFDEPVPARDVVPEGSRVYLNDRGLKDLSSVDDAFKLGDKIDYVNLDRNELEAFPLELTALSGVKWLRLNGNRLSSLPADVSNLKSLRRIYLRDNRFASVPDALKDLPKLTDIDLSGNPLAEIPGWLAEKRGLESLSFSRTRVRKLPDDLSAWKTLKQLQLGDLNLSGDEMARIRAVLPKTAIVF